MFSCVWNKFLLVKMAFHVAHNCRCYTISLTSSCPTSQAYCSDTLRNCLWLQHNLLVMSVDLWLLLTRLFCFLCFLSDLVDEESACNAGDWGLIPGWGRFPGEGHGYLLQYPCLENPMDRGAWWAIVPGVTKSQTWLSDWAGMHCGFSGFIWGGMLWSHCAGSRCPGLGETQSIQ